MDFKPAAVYRMVERLVSGGLVEEVGTEQQGKRPERTVYRLTEEGAGAVLELGAGHAGEAVQGVRQLHRRGLLPAVLLPDAARAVLEMRATLLDAEIARVRSLIESAARASFPRLFILEEELGLAAMEAEARWARGVVEDLATGRPHLGPGVAVRARPAVHSGHGVGDAWRNARMG